MRAVVTAFCLAALALLWALPVGAAPSSLHRLTATPGVRESFPVFVGGPRIAYLSASGLHSAAWQDELWMAAPDGSGAKRVLGAGCFHLRVSHSRRMWLACSRYVGVRPVKGPDGPAGWEAHTEVWAVRAGDAWPVKVAGPGSWFLDAWGRAGDLYLHEGRLGYNDAQGFYEATGFPPLRAYSARPWIDRALRPLPGDRVSSTSCDRSDWAQLREAGVWSPTGRECIRVCRYRRGDKPYVGYDLVRPGQAPRRILESEEHLTYARRPWLPVVAWLGTRRVLLQRFHARPDPEAPQSSGTFALVVVEAATGACQPFAPGVRSGAFPDPVLSPGGGRVLLRAQGSSGTPGLWVVSSSGGHPRRVLDGEGECTPWAWSPDGRSLILAREGDLWRIDL